MLIRRPVGSVLVAVVVMLVALVAGGCGGGKSSHTSGSRTAPAAGAAAGSAPAGSAARPALASVQVPPIDSRTPRIRLDLVGLNRWQGHVTVQIRMTNLESAGGGTLGMGWQLMAEGGSVSDNHWPNGIGLVDTAAHKLLLPYALPPGRGCLCSSDVHDGIKSRFDLHPGQSTTIFAILPAPLGTPKTATIVTPAAPPFTNVPISDTPPAPLPGQPFPDPTSTDAAAVDYQIMSSYDAADNSSETIDSGSDIAVNLAADVLFDVGKADLTPRAVKLLTTLAKQIDASISTIIQIQGHTDSSGTDAINDPLSQRRAEAVRTRLRGLVTRQGITFLPRGFGSHRPLWPNDTPVGRGKNRRVTIIFAKPRTTPLAPPSVASPSKPTAAVTSRNDKGISFSAQVVAVRSIGGGLGVLTYRLTNHGTSRSDLGLAFGESWMGLKYIAANSVAVLDQATGLHYATAWYLVPSGSTQSRICACQGLAGVRLGMDGFDPGVPKEFWALLPLPATSTVNVEITPFPVIANVPVT